MATSLRAISPRENSHHDRSAAGLVNGAVTFADGVRAKVGLKSEAPGDYSAGRQSCRSEFLVQHPVAAEVRSPYRGDSRPNLSCRVANITLLRDKV